MVLCRYRARCLLLRSRDDPAARKRRPAESRHSLPRRQRGGSAERLGQIQRRARFSREGPIVESVRPRCTCFCVLRGIKSAIQYKETEKIRAIDENESIQLLQTLVKQRKESIDQFTKGNRPDLADKETKELAIIETYLPAAASDAEMDAAITKAIAETSATSMKQMGAVVKAAKAALEGKNVDGKALSDRVRSRLS